MNSASQIQAENQNQERKISVRLLLVMPDRGLGNLEKPKRSLSPPNPLHVVAALTPKEVEVKIFDELVNGPIDEKTLGWADLVGISGLSTSHFGMIRAADKARELGIKVIGGGMHLTGLYLEDGALDLRSHFDAVVIGWLTRRLWEEALEDARENRLRPVYQAHPDEEREFVVPRHDLSDPSRYELPAVIRSSAGCTERCEFCTVHLVCGRGVRVKPREIIKRELEIIPKTSRPITVDLADSFGADYEHTIRDVLPLYAASGRPWFTEMTFRNFLGGDGREPLYQRMADAGCMAVYFGVENPFAKMGAKFVGREEIERAIRLAHKAGMAVMVSEILDGLGTETEESIKAMVEWNIDQGVGLVQYALAAALPGSVLRRRMLRQNKIICWNWRLHCGAYPTIEHGILSPKERIELLEYAYRRTYHPLVALKRIWGHPHFRFSLVANGVVSGSVHRWWDKGELGYEYWEKTRKMV